MSVCYCDSAVLEAETRLSLLLVDDNAWPI